HGVALRPASSYRPPPRPDLPADLDGRICATADADPVRRYFAIVTVMEEGGGDDPWRLRLTEVARDDENPMVRLRARAALGKLGDGDSVTILRSEASGARHVCLRAEALEGLVAIDAAACF